MRPDGHEGSLQLAVTPLVQTVLAKGYHLSETYDGVGQPCRVAQE